MGILKCSAVLFVLTILLMVAWSCFNEMARFLKARKKSSLGSSEDRTLIAKVQHHTVTSNFKRHSIINLKVLTMVYGFCFLRFFLRL